MNGLGRTGTAGLILALGLVLAGAVSAQVRPDRTAPGVRPDVVAPPRPSGPMAPGKDVAPVRGGQICVVAYDDRNGNGRRDGGEGPLLGQSFTVANAAGSTLAQGATGGDGRFCTPRPLPFGDYRVRQVIGGGLTNTDPGKVSPNMRSVSVRAAIPVTVLFGNCRGAGCAGGTGVAGGPAPGAPDTPLAQRSTFNGRICVLKFNDLNNDKVKQGTELPLSGWAFSVTGPSGTYSGVTDSNGSWCTPNVLLPGTYSVTETLKTGWVSTTPGGATPTLSVNVSPNQTRLVFFGNRLAPPPPSGQLNIICINKIHDKNGNGQWDPGDLRLPEWNFTISGNGVPDLHGAGDPVDGRWCTDQVLPDGTYTITETQQPGWVGTNPVGSPPAMTVTLPPVDPWQRWTEVYFYNRKYPILVIDKIVTSTAPGGGFPPPPAGTFSGPGEFLIHYSCPAGSVLGSVALPANGSASVGLGGALQAGWTCTVWESPVPGPSAYSGCESGQGYWDTPTTSLLSPLVAGENKVTITNKFVCVPPTPVARVCVQKFHDVDGDQQKHPWMESALAGWSFSITGPSGTFPVVTASNGWCQSNLIPGVYTVTETQQLGWVSTVPGGAVPTISVNVGPNQTKTVFFGNQKAPSLLFNKVVTSTAPGGGYPPTGLPGGAFQISHNCVQGGQINSGTTNVLAGQTGAVDNLSVGAVCTVTETLPQGNIPYAPCHTGSGYWEPALIASSPVTIVPGVNTVTVTNRFVCTPPPAPGKVCVTKYNDLNGDGARQSTEPGLTGWTFTVKNANGATVTTLTSTSGYPACSPFILPPGNYTITENLPATGWVNTDPGGAAVETFTVAAGGTYNAVFGNVQLGKICVRKYNDVNGNGSWSGASSGPEPFMTGVPFEVKDSSGQVVHTGLTAALGMYCTPNILMPGVYTVTETVPDGWTNTQPGGAASVTVTIPTPYGGPTDFWFGNQKDPLPGELCVEKYNDLNGDGDQDPGEGPLQGWTFTRSGGGMPTLSGDTGANGRWCPGTELPPGIYTVTETPQTGWTSTDPGGSTPVKTAVIASNVTTTVEFGNQADGPNLTLVKTKLTAGSCHGAQPGANNCTFRFTITNSGSSTYTGPLSISDTVTMGGGSLPVSVVTAPAGWSCSTGTQTPIVCGIGSVSIAAGATVTYDLQLFLNAPMPSQKNCAVLTWGGQQTGPACVQIFP